MLLRFWRPGSRFILCMLALTALIALAACQQSGPANTVPTNSPGSAPSSSSARNHVPAGTRPQFVRVTFTAATTYDQARALLTSVGQIPYPWACSDLYFDGTPSPAAGQYSVRPVTTPPPSAEQDTPEAYAASHQFLVPYPTEQQMNQIAASDAVVSLDAVRLPACL